MPAEATGRSAIVTRIFAVFALLGALIAVAGIGLDLVPGTSPGLSAPQILMIIGGNSPGSWGLHSAAPRDP